MTHEFKKIVQEYKMASALDLKCVLATVVALEGSSYRRPGVRMLIRKDDKMIGAVSGGCVEKEILFQAQSVFEDQTPKLMTYDGRYRLGCEGILYLLIEPFSPSVTALEAFESVLLERKSFSLITSYEMEFGSLAQYGTTIHLDGASFPLHPTLRKQEGAHYFEQHMEPCKRLLIIGGEHDAVQLSHFAIGMGWEVGVAVTPKEDKTKDDFPGIEEFLNYEPEDLPLSYLDNNTAVVLMTHSFAKDLKYLTVLKNTSPMYLGLLGPSKRREKLLDALLEQDLDIDLAFVENIHGPAGLNIGAETPQEIAISILAELLAVIRNTEPMKLKDKENRIHH